MHDFTNSCSHLNVGVGARKTNTQKTLVAIIANAHKREKRAHTHKKGKQYEKQTKFFPFSLSLSNLLKLLASFVAESVYGVFDEVQ